MIGLIFQAWAAFSPLASILGVLGVACVLVAFFGAMFVPERLKLPIIGLGVVLIVGAAVWQAAEAKGAHDAFAAAKEVALKAERERADKAEAITRDLAEQATRDLASAQADASNLKGLISVLSQNPQAGRVCLDRSIARRLRAL